MKDLLLYIARNLVDDPDSVSVTEVQGDQELTLELRVVRAASPRRSGPWSGLTPSAPALRFPSIL